MNAAKPARFHAFTVKHKGRVNRVHTDVLVMDAFDPQNPPAKKPSAHKAKALWDTGATASVITTATAKALGLTPTGTAMVGHAGGSSLMNTYVVHIHLPNGVRVHGVQVTESPGIANGAGAIIGMDIIGIGDFSITNASGTTTMSYRLPSIKHIDYVAETQSPLVSGKVAGRNQKCPCGSGKKYKNCCGK